MFKLFTSCCKKKKSEKHSTESRTSLSKEIKEVRKTFNRIQNQSIKINQEIEKEFLEKISEQNESLERELTKEEKEKLKQIILMLNLYEYNML